MHSPILCARHCSKVLWSLTHLRKSHTDSICMKLSKMGLNYYQIEWNLAILQNQQSIYFPHLLTKLFHFLVFISYHYCSDQDTEPAAHEARQNLVILEGTRFSGYVLAVWSATIPPSTSFSCISLIIMEAGRSHGRQLDVLRAHS